MHALVRVVVIQVMAFLVMVDVIAGFQLLQLQVPLDPDLPAAIAAGRQVVAGPVVPAVLPTIQHMEMFQTRKIGPVV